MAKKFGIKESEILQLGSNENPYPPSEKVKEAYFNSFSSINRYPTPFYHELKEAISSYCGVDVEQIAVGNGAGEILRHITEAVVDTMDPVVIPVPGYTLYGILAMLRDAIIHFEEIPGYDIQAEQILKKQSKLLFLCSPNNPTGNTIQKREIVKILKNYSGFVVMDEAYAEFADSSVVKLVDEFSNLIVVRSFSKFFGLAGLRIGYLVANTELVEGIEKIRYPFSISCVARNTAIAALDSLDYYLELKKQIIRERENLIKKLSKLPSLQVYPSEANFILVRVLSDKDVAAELEDQKIIVRNITGLMGLDGYHVRITVGTEEENGRLIEALEKIES